MYNLERVIGVLAGITIAVAQVTYLINTIKKTIRPSVLSWLGWSFLMGTSLVSQILAKGWKWSMTAIAFSTLGSLAISGVAWMTKQYNFKRSDLWFLVAGLGCVGVYMFSRDPWVTTVFAIIADATLGIPTIRNAISHPASERSAAWLLGVIAAVMSLILCVHHELIFVLFPAYLFLFNGAMALLTRK